MNVLSLFSGVGGLDLGLERAGLTVTGQCEIDAWRRRVLAWHWPTVPCAEDVAALGRRDLQRSGHLRLADPAERQRDELDGAVDLLCGGFPCQDVSVAGRRAGLNGTRSGLFFEYARITNELRPRWLLVENVPGLLSSADGRDFALVLSTLANLGYGLAWRVLDARYFGVPQRRRRVFLIGHSGGDPEPAVHAVGAGGEGDLAAGRCSWQRAPHRTADGAGNAGDPRRDHAVCLTSNERWDLDTETFITGDPVVVSALQAPNGRGWRVDAEGAAGGHLIAAIQGGAQQDQFVGDNGTVPTLAHSSNTHHGNHQPKYVGATGVRRLTPIECERLMSWPDNWTAVDGEATPDSRRYAACGDGVVSNVAEWIGRRILHVDAQVARIPRLSNA